MNLPFLSSGIQAGPCPAEDFHAAGGSVLAPCSSAVYSLVVIRRRVEGRTTEQDEYLGCEVLSPERGDNCAIFRDQEKNLCGWV